ncbi:MAG: NAD(P)-dependent oxidoreductase [Caldilineaceae bacterium]|nr:NAD(P)-dependent oxidoreductase [Caldilineaceae bacterium]
MTKILVTGMSGLIGGVVRSQLGGDYELSALNRRPVDGIPTVQADIGDFEAMRPAFDGQDVVIHLAANASGSAPWTEILHANLLGTHNVYEAARQAGVQRVIFASSGTVVAGWEKDDPYRALVNGAYDAAPPSWPMITHESPIRPRGDYGSSKAWGEAAARQFVDSSDLSILCLRIGHVTEEDRPMSVRDYSVWCSQRDIGQMIALCVAAPADLRFGVFFVVSENKWGYRDINHARQVLGFEPQDAAEDYR